MVGVGYTKQQQQQQEWKKHLAGILPEFLAFKII